MDDDLDLDMDLDPENAALLERIDEEDFLAEEFGTELMRLCCRGFALGLAAGAVAVIGDGPLGGATVVLTILIGSV